MVRVLSVSGAPPPLRSSAFGVSFREGHYVDQISRPFFTTKGEVGGTGLGLRVVEHIVDRYGGKIEHLNRPGDGVTFNVALPLPASS
jgi:signal transduction histidine kinase